MAEIRGRTELYVIVEAGEAAREKLLAALAAAPVASVLIVPTRGVALDAAAARPLVEAAQSAGAAALILNDVRLARALRADGVHLASAGDLEAAYAEAREVLGHGIVGVDAGGSRHDAMTLAEAGADYVAFGALPLDGEEARVRRDEMAAWWAEIFEVPCVAFDVETAAEAEALAAAGADFVAVRLPADTSPAAVRGLVRGMAAAVGLAETGG